MKFFYGLLVLALFAAAQGAPAETQTGAAAPVAVAGEKPVEKAEVTTVEKDDEEVKKDNQALEMINNVLESIIESGVLGDALAIKTEDNVDMLIDTLKSMDPVLKFMEGIRTKHPVFGHVITQYKNYRNAIESQIRIFLAPFNLIIGAVGHVFRMFG